MPYKMKKIKGGYKNEGPSGDKSDKPMTLKNAKAQMRLLQGIEHGWKPTKGGKK